MTSEQRTLSFHATRLPVDLPPHSVPILGFEAGEEGDPSACLSLMYEEGGGVVRAWWRLLGQPLCIELVISNRGGPLDGVDVELGGAALDGGLVRVAEVSSPEGTAVREGAVWRAPSACPRSW